MKRIVTVSTLSAILVLGAFTSAFASIPDSSGVIHGCRKNSDGSVRVIDSDAGQTCANGWTALNWSQTGPQGPAGYLSSTGVITASQNYSVAAGNWHHFTLTCPGSNGTNRVAVNGGFEASAGGTDSSTIVPGSHPTAGGDGWEWWVYRFAGTGFSYITVRLTCLELQ